jgi:hypothetical protein
VENEAEAEVEVEEEAEEVKEGAEEKEAENEEEAEKENEEEEEEEEEEDFYGVDGELKNPKGSKPVSNKAADTKIRRAAGAYFAKIYEKYTQLKRIPSETRQLRMTQHETGAYIGMLVLCRKWLALKTRPLHELRILTKLPTYKDLKIPSAHEIFQRPSIIGWNAGIKELLHSKGSPDKGTEDSNGKDDADKDDADKDSDGDAGDKRPRKPKKNVTPSPTRSSTRIQKDSKAQPDASAAKKKQYWAEKDAALETFKAHGDGCEEAGMRKLIDAFLELNPDLRGMMFVTNAGLLPPLFHYFPIKGLKLLNHKLETDYPS